MIYQQQNAYIIKIFLKLLFISLFHLFLFITYIITYSFQYNILSNIFEIAVYFVSLPRNVRYHDAKQAFKDCDENCAYTSTRRRCYFIKSSKSLESLNQKEFQGGMKLRVELSKSLNEEQFDQLVKRKQERFNQIKEQNKDKPKEQQNTEKKQKQEQKPRQNNQRKRQYRAFVYIRDGVTFEDVGKYFKHTLKTNIVSITQIQDKNYGYLFFDTLEDCRQARKLFMENKMENVYVRPYIPRRHNYYRRRNNRSEKQE